MHFRCSKNDKRGYWGARGICVCTEWNDFEAFFLDMGERPEGTTLDRIDNNKGYSLENCRWATLAQQSDNRRCVSHYTMNGKTLNLREWEREYNLPINLLYHRLKAGMTLEDAIVKPVHKAQFNDYSVFRAHRNQYLKNWAQKNKDNGKCIRCSALADDGRAVCAKCREKTKTCRIKRGMR